MKRDRWLQGFGIKYRIRAYTRVEGPVLEDAELRAEAEKPEGVPA
jgi:hypothetical protein